MWRKNHNTTRILAIQFQFQIIDILNQTLVMHYFQISYVHMYYFA